MKEQNIIFKWVLILSIVIIANLFFNYSLSLIFNGPEYTDFCQNETKPFTEDPKTCSENGGEWKAQAPATAEKTPAGFCDYYSKCQREYEEANKVYEKKVFLSLIPIGVIVLLASIFIKGNPVLVSALSLTAFLDFIVASARYWRYSDEILKVAILFVALVVLIYLAIRKFKEKTNAGIQS